MKYQIPEKIVDIESFLDGSYFDENFESVKVSIILDDYKQVRGNIFIEKGKRLSDFLNGEKRNYIPVINCKIAGKLQELLLLRTNKIVGILPTGNN